MSAATDCLQVGGPAGGGAAAVLVLGWALTLLAALGLARLDAVSRLEAAAAARLGPSLTGVGIASLLAAGLLGAGALVDAGRRALGDAAAPPALAPGGVVGLGVVFGALSWAALSLLRRRPALLVAGGAVAAALIAFQFLAAPLVVDPARRGDQPAPPGASARALIGFARTGGLAADRLDVFARGDAAAVDAEGVGPVTRLAVSRAALEAPAPETYAALGHILGHHAHGDLELLAAILILGLGLKLSAARWGPPLLGRLVGRAPPAWSPAALPLIVAAVLLADPVGRIAFNLADQRVNLRADAFSLRLTGDPGALCRWIRSDAPAGEADATGPASLLLQDHPPLAERLAAIRRAAAGRPVNRASAAPELRPVR